MEKNTKIIIGGAAAVVILGLAGYALLGTTSDDPMPSSSGDGQTATQEQGFPTLDIARFEDGLMVIAGRGRAGSTLDVLIDDESVVDTRIRRDGSWAATAEVFIEPGEHFLRLEETTVDGKILASVDRYVILLDEGTGSPIVARVRADGSLQILQKDSDAEISVDTISYGADGKPIVSGTAKPNETVRVLVGSTVVTATADEDGNWSTPLGEDVPAGVLHQITAVNESGEGVQIPFVRDRKGIVVEGDQVVVQPGNSLWRIARHVYGRGVFYTEIHKVNTKIEDPDLIFPGQIFDLPEVERN